MVATTTYICPEDGCEKITATKQGLSHHRTRMHKSLSASQFGVQDGRVEIDLEQFGGELPKRINGGFKKALFGSVTTYAVSAIWLLLIYQSATTSIINAIGLTFAWPIVLFAAWYLSEKNSLLPVGVIRDPKDADGMTRVHVEWWPKALAQKLPEEARRTHNDMYVIDARGDTPLAFTPFTVQQPEYAIPVRGAMVNQQTDNEQLNKVHYKGIRPETITQAFYMGGIGILTLANYAVFSQLLEYVNS